MDIIPSHKKRDVEEQSKDEQLSLPEKILLLDEMKKSNSVRITLNGEEAERVFGPELDNSDLLTLGGIQEGSSDDEKSDNNEEEEMYLAKKPTERKTRRQRNAKRRRREAEHAHNEKVKKN
eukprot:UN24421